ncbi:MAG: glucokinase [bacterium]|nr:glucokinase [bacterium]MCP5069174.1 glucokinase [bacterium]
MILAGDIGGTKTVLALFDTHEGSLERREMAIFPSQEHPTFEEVVEAFRSEYPTEITAACFGVAGAIIDGCAQTTNLPWKLDEQALGLALGGCRVKLLNDLEAAGLGMLELPEASLHSLQQGRVRRGNAAVIAAGTGLGEAMLFFDGEKHTPTASEGGHADFAPRTERDVALLHHLRAKLGGRVSVERVISGPGIASIHDFLIEFRDTSAPEWLCAARAAGDASAAIADAALAKRDPVCVETLELFASLYGAEAGNHALRCMAIGGVYIGGGVAPKILPFLSSGAFMQAFLDKGRFSNLMSEIPIAIALDPLTPLLGAARMASRL